MNLKLTINAVEVLKRRYLLKDDEQKVIEAPIELFRRVASHVARAETEFRHDAPVADVEERFYHMMRSLEFMPNSPTLMNGGTPLGQLSACFVLPVEDSIDGIFESLKNMALIHQSGGGTGFNFSNLRPEGSLVSSTKGGASGPVSFMSIFDKEAVDFAGKLMGFIRRESVRASAELAEQRGVFPNFDKSVYAGKGPRLPETNPVFEQAVRKRGIYSKEMLAEISMRGSVQKIRKLPRDLKRLFVTALDIEPFDHLRIQAAFQKHTDNAVSKTINLPQHATVEDVRRIYLMAHELRCKGITIYRYGSKDLQVLTTGGEPATADAEYSGGCASGPCVF